MCRPSAAQVSKGLCWCKSCKPLLTTFVNAVTTTTQLGLPVPLRPQSGGHLATQQLLACLHPEDVGARGREVGLDLPQCQTNVQCLLRECVIFGQSTLYGCRPGQKCNGCPLQLAPSWQGWQRPLPLVEGLQHNYGNCGIALTFLMWHSSVFALRLEVPGTLTSPP